MSNFIRCPSKGRILNARDRKRQIEKENERLSKKLNYIHKSGGSSLKVKEAKAATTNIRLNKPNPKKRKDKMKIEKDNYELALRLMNSKATLSKAHHEKEYKKHQDIMRLRRQMNPPKSNVHALHPKPFEI